MQFNLFGKLQTKNLTTADNIKYNMKMLKLFLLFAQIQLEIIVIALNNSETKNVLVEKLNEIVKNLRCATHSPIHKFSSYMNFLKWNK